MTSTPWMDLAESYIGQKEISGSRHNPVIVEFFKKSDASWVLDDETPWCSAFVNAVLYDLGIKGTNKLNARSWLDWAGGDTVNTPKYGDIVVFWRGSKSGWQGHVGFFVKWDNNSIWVLGGNQSNGVNISKMSRSRLLGFKRPRQEKFEPPKVPKMEPPAKPTEWTDFIFPTGFSITALSSYFAGFDKEFIMVSGIVLTILITWGYIVYKDRLRA